MLIDAKLGAKAGEVPLIEGAKSKAAEGIARNLCDRSREWNWKLAGIWAGSRERRLCAERAVVKGVYKMPTFQNRKA